jgi:5'-deoxynucleotidase YfbR-like HD superfamily hydrolase
MPKTATDYFGSEARKHAEQNAFLDIVGATGATAAAYESLYRDYEQRSSVEARLVKAADVIDLLIQAYALERAGAKGLDEFWEVAESPNFQLPADVEQVVTELMASILEARATLR